MVDLTRLERAPPILQGSCSASRCSRPMVPRVGVAPTNNCFTDSSAPPARYAGSEGTWELPSCETYAPRAWFGPSTMAGYCVVPGPLLKLCGLPPGTTPALLPGGAAKNRTQSSSGLESDRLPQPQPHVHLKQQKRPLVGAALRNAWSVCLDPF